jgi:hypothetical protein
MILIHIKTLSTLILSGKCEMRQDNIAADLELDCRFLGANPERDPFDIVFGFGRR